MGLGRSTQMGTESISGEDGGTSQANNQENVSGNAGESDFCWSYIRTNCCIGHMKGHTRISLMRSGAVCMHQYQQRIDKV
jgi:hypothetical protein